MRLILICLLALSVQAQAATAGIPVAGGLPAHARLALCGDSITEQMLYTRYVEAYLLACAGRIDVSVFQFGWGGENADQFGNRIQRGDLDAFTPTLVTFLYGANDAGGMAWQDWLQGMWNGRISGILDRLAARYPGAGRVICGPTWFDLNSAGSNAAAVAVRNDTLDHFRGLNRDLAQATGSGFADVRERMRTVSAAAQRGLGAVYRIGGSDGVHAGPNGHLIIAYEILRTLGQAGEIARITLDMSGSASASAGHTIGAWSAGSAQVLSTRYPFCYAYDASAAADRMPTILPYLPFSQDLNRFILVVEHLQTTHANVTWGGQTLTFSAAELAAGVNMSAAFAITPFDAAFANLMALIATKQDFERAMIKAAGDAIASTAGWTPADVVQRNALDATVHAGVVPVTHTIRVEPIGSTPVAPLVSGASISAVVGTAFTYQIQAVNAPTRYAASDLPTGLVVDATSGLITGTPSQVVSGQVVGLSASNAAGTGTALLNLTIAMAVDPPAITSPQTATGTVGVPFRYQIAASRTPSTFYATGLPTGLSLNARSGLISGTPVAAGAVQVLISAENAGGNGPAVTLGITVEMPDAPPSPSRLGR
jgi:hypothetical protein